MQHVRRVDAWCTLFASRLSDGAHSFASRAQTISRAPSRSIRITDAHFNLGIDNEMGELPALRGAYTRRPALTRS